MRSAVLSASLFVGLTACRDAVEPWTQTEPQPDPVGPLQLTWSTGNDLHPRWMAAGDTIIYAGDGFPGLPIAPGLLLRIPSTGGAAQLLIPVLQSSVSLARRYAQPAISRTDERIAFFELAGTRAPARVLSEGCTAREPLLDSVVIRTRSPVAEASSTADLSILLAGPDPAQRALRPGPYDVRLLGFQEAWAESGDLLLRPDWSPDGGRVVFSDGQRLFLWTPGSAPQPIPGTSDAVSPAWSPDGEWIAFSRRIRQDSSFVACDIGVGVNTEVQRRWTYDFASSQLVQIRPDGSGSTDLGPGQDPAWAPDGSLVFSNAGRLQRRTSAGILTDIPGTDGGRWPSPSPSGESVAFVRVNPSSGFDLWVTTLER